jgi:hypothetical protein
MPARAEERTVSVARIRDTDSGELGETKRGRMATRRYEFRVEGTLSDEARAAFVDMRITESPPQTLVDGDVVDESHLHGIIAQFQALGITVVAALPVPPRHRRTTSEGAEPS